MSIPLDPDVTRQMQHEGLLPIAKPALPEREVNPTIAKRLRLAFAVSRSDADLSDADLSDADLSDADLSDADLAANAVDFSDLGPDDLLEVLQSRTPEARALLEATSEPE